MIRGCITLAEEHVVTGREGACAQRMTKAVGMRVGVNTHAAEVGAERGLHLAARAVVQALATTTRLVDRSLYCVESTLAGLAVPCAIQDSTDIKIAVLPLQAKQRRMRG